MLDRPIIPDESILTALRTAFALPVTTLRFLPLGADTNTAVYRAESDDDTAYFVKLRLDDFHEASLTIPRYLYDQGLRHVIPPRATPTGQRWTPLGDYRLTVYPFVAGQSGYEYGMTAAHWHAFGATLRQLHDTPFPAELICTISREDFTPIWPARMQVVLRQLAHVTTAEPVTQALRTFLESKTVAVVDLIATVDRLAAVLRAAPPPFVLCHGDCHGWNLLIDDQEQLFLVDWDTLIVAPAARDLMFIGGGHGDSGYSAAEEERLFYQGYGQTTVNHTALAYYRFARALEDITLFAEQILTTDAGEDRQQALVYLQSNFLPESTLARAYHALYYSNQLWSIVRKGNRVRGTGQA